MNATCPACFRLVPTGDAVCARCGTDLPAAQAEAAPAANAGPRGATSSGSKALDKGGVLHCDGQGLSPGALLDDARLEITHWVGEGGTADVYGAYDHSLGCYVALKLLRADLLERPRALECLQAEASTLATLKHPGILRLFRTTWVGPRFGLVLELLPGGDLESQRPAGGFGAEQALVWILQVLDALDAMHARGLVHRDLKLENILLDAQGNAKLADLGIRFDMRDVDDTLNLCGKTGTPRTMSPEQARGDKVDQRSDIYTAALLLCELATGRLPLVELPDGRIDPASWRSPDLRTVRATLGGPIGDVIGRALQQEPDQRFQRALAMRDAIDAARGQRACGRRLRLGRDVAQVDIVVDGDGVSGVHCELHWLGDYVVVTDLDSTNGTFVQGRRLEPFRPLAIALDDTVWLGRTVAVQAETLLRVGR